MDRIKGKKVAIVGFGKEGLAAANYLGKDNKIIVFDKKSKNEIGNFLKNLKYKSIDFYFQNSLPKDLSFDYLVRSPGVRPDDWLVAKILKKGAVLTSPTRIFFDQNQGKVIGVTGTKGKGTTATLIYEFLKTITKNVFLAGNIGKPALEILPYVTKESLVVLELSSFQLIDLQKSPQIAVVLMITYEHLDWHQNQFEYRKAKEPIVLYQNSGDFAVINADFAASLAFGQKTKAQVFYFSINHKTNGVYLEKDLLISEIAGKEVICQASQVRLPGIHNLQNVAAAVAVAKILNTDNGNILKVIETFKGLPHRLQLVGKIDGISFYDDSYSTTPETTIAAIEAFKRPKILVLGGSSKKSNFRPLAKKIANDPKIKSIILIGEEGPRIAKAIAVVGGFGGTIIEKAPNMREIVRQARLQAKSGDVVILSPGCASFDMFKNYQDRAEQFAREVERLGK